MSRVLQTFWVVLEDVYPYNSGNSLQNHKGRHGIFSNDARYDFFFVKKYEEDVETGEKKVSFLLAWNFNQNPGQKLRPMAFYIGLAFSSTSISSQPVIIALKCAQIVSPVVAR